MDIVKHVAVGISATILDVHTSRLNGCCWQIRRPAPDEEGTLRAAATPFRACRDTRAENDMSDHKNRNLQLFRYLCCFRLGVAVRLFVVWGATFAAAMVDGRGGNENGSMLGDGKTKGFGVGLRLSTGNL